MINKKSNTRINKNLNKKTNKKTNKKSNKSVNKKSNKKLNKKGGNNESINSNIVITEVKLETINITPEQFKKLLLINTFYEVYSNILDKEDETLSLISTTTSIPAIIKKRKFSQFSNKSGLGNKTQFSNNSGIGNKTQPSNTPRTYFQNPINPFNNKRVRVYPPPPTPPNYKGNGGAFDEHITKDINENIYLLLSYLDNVHDFAGNNRCKIEQPQDFFKDYIKKLYIKLGLKKSLMDEYDYKEGIILYKILERYPFLYKNMVFKMNKKFIKEPSTSTISTSTTSTPITSLTGNNIDKNEYIVQILDDTTIPKEVGQCILYDSPVYRLTDYDLMYKKNNIFTSIEIKNNSTINTPPEKLFDSGTGYKKGLCISKKPTSSTLTSTPNISLNYNTYPLFNILNIPLISNEIRFKKESDKLCYMQNCGIYNLKSGYSIRQLKEWIIKNIDHFKLKRDLRVINPLRKSEYMSNLTTFINNLIFKLNELRIRINDNNLLKFYTAMSIKRLGDWGMVNRNIEDNNIFITNDTLCALYAILKESKLIFHVPSSYSNKLIENKLIEDISDKNMGLIGFYNINRDRTITPTLNTKLDEFIRKQKNIISRKIEEINRDDKKYKDLVFIHEKLNT